MSLELSMLLWLITKHIIADYYLQFSWMFKYKAIYGHPGGLAHAGLHGIFTFIVFSAFVNPFVAFNLAMLDSVLHYHIDFVKSNVWKAKQLTPSDQLYWIVHGTDQFLHFLTYFLLIHIAVPWHV